MHVRFIKSNRIIRIIYCMNEHLYIPITEITVKIYDPNDDWIFRMQIILNLKDQLKIEEGRRKVTIGNEETPRKEFNRHNIYGTCLKMW